MTEAEETLGYAAATILGIGIISFMPDSGGYFFIAFGAALGSLLAFRYVLQGDNNE